MYNTPTIPIICGIAAHGVSYTSVFLPQNSPLRVPILTATILITIYGVAHPTRSALWGDVYLEYMLGFIFHAIHGTYIDPPVAPAHLPWLEKLKCVVSWGFTCREIDHTGQEKRSDDGTKAEQSERTRFLVRKLKSVCIKLLIRYCFQRFPMELHLEDFLPVRKSLLRRLPEVEVREMIVRLYIAFSVVSSTYLELGAAHGILSSIAVGIFRQPPSQWPDLFGSLASASTIRGYWGNFWHKLMRKAFVANASSLVYGFFGFPRIYRKRGRILVLFTVFFLSGIMHATMGYLDSSAACKTGSALRTIRYYMTIPSAILLEDIVIRTARSFGIGENENLLWLWKGVGYLWVVFFHVWALPKLIYPSVMCKHGVIV